MSDRHLFESESKINGVLKMHHDDLNGLKDSKTIQKTELESNISKSEALLLELGIQTPDKMMNDSKVMQRPLIIRDFEDISTLAEERLTTVVAIEDLFSKEELADNHAYFIELRKQFKDIHKLDKWDYSVAGIAGTVAALTDYFLVTKVTLSDKEVKTGPLKSGVEKFWDTLLPPEKVSRLESKFKVPFDISTNTSKISQEVLGLNPWYHRFQSLGHDPLLGFVFGIKDMMRGELTAIDGNGRWIVQRVAGFEEKGFIEAVITQFGHLLSDVSASSPTGMKLSIPAPLTPLLQMIKVGNVSYKGKVYTVADLSKRMYADGYNFNHFISMSVPVVMIHIIVGLYTTLRSLFSEDYAANRHKTDMILFTANSILCAENIGKLVVTKNPFAINYVSWIDTAKYSTRVMKHVMVDYQIEELAYVQTFIDSEFDDTYAKVEATWDKYNSDRPVLYI